MAAMSEIPFRVSTSGNAGTARRRAKKTAAPVVVPAAEDFAPRPFSNTHRVGVEGFVDEGQAGLDIGEQFADMRRVHLDVERADHRAEAPDAEPDDQLLQAFLGEQADPVPGPYIPLGEEVGDPVRGVVEPREVDIPAGVEVDDRGLGGMAVVVAREQRRYRFDGKCQIVLSGAAVA